MGMLDGKRFIIFGVASKRSIAWGIAEAMHREGATLAFTYQNDRLKDRVIDIGTAYAFVYLMNGRVDWPKLYHLRAGRCDETAIRGAATRIKCCTDTKLITNSLLSDVC